MESYFIIPIKSVHGEAIDVFAASAVSTRAPEADRNQPYLYGGKELERMHGLSEYDFGARRLPSHLPVWTTQDPCLEKYYPTSPYAYCAGNPINYIDVYGKSIFKISKEGKLYRLKTNDDNYHIIQNHDGTSSIQVPKDFVETSIRYAFNDKGEENVCEIYIGEGDGMDIFTFMIQNTNVEWTKTEYSNGHFILGTSNLEYSDHSATYILNEKRDWLPYITCFDHSHTGSRDSYSDSDVITAQLLSIYNPNIICRIFLKTSFEPNSGPNHFSPSSPKGETEVLPELVVKPAINQNSEQRNVKKPDLLESKIKDLPLFKTMPVNKIY